MDHKHIRTISNSNNISVVDDQLESSAKNTSLSTEAQVSANTSLALDLRSIIEKVGSSRGGTFAQRARAAELQAARSLRESEIGSKDSQPSASPQQQTTLPLKMPRRTKWTPLAITYGVQSNTLYPSTPSGVTDSADRSHSAEMRTSETTGIDQEKKQEEDGPFVRQNLIERQSMNSSEIGNASRTPLSDTASAVLESRPWHKKWIEMYGSDREDSLIAQPVSSQALIQNSLPVRVESGPSLPSQENENSSSNDDNRTNSMKVKDEILRNWLRDNVFAPRTNVDRLSLYNGPPFQRVPDYVYRPYPAVRGTPMASLDNTNRMASPVEMMRRRLVESQDGGRDWSWAKSWALSILDPVLTKPSDVESWEINPDTHPLVVEALACRRQEESIKKSRQQIFNNGQSSRSSTGMNSEAQGLPPHHSVSGQPHQEATGFGRHANRSFELPPFTPEARFQAYDRLTRQHKMLTQQAIDMGKHAHRSLELSPFTSDPSKAFEQLTKEEKVAAQAAEVNEWWTRDNRVSQSVKDQVEGTVSFERLTHAHRAAPTGDIAEANDSIPWTRDPAATYTNEEMVDELLVPVLANLISYRTDKTNLNPFGPPPSWAIDHTPGGNESFFSRQWGSPPLRVGRDPRYRALQHDGRSSVFEDPTGRFPREEYIHDRGHGTHRWSGF